jgi:hypothetical protein
LFSKISATVAAMAAVEVALARRAKLVAQAAAKAAVEPGLGGFGLVLAGAIRLHRGVSGFRSNVGKVGVARVGQFAGCSVDLGQWRPWWVGSAGRTGDDQQAGAKRQQAIWRPIGPACESHIAPN